MKNYKIHHSSVSLPSLSCSTVMVGGKQTRAPASIAPLTCTVFLKTWRYYYKLTGKTNLYSNRGTYPSVWAKFPRRQLTRASCISVEWLLCLLVRTFDTTRRPGWNPKLLFLFCPRQEWDWCFARSLARSLSTQRQREGKLCGDM